MSATSSSKTSFDVAVVGLGAVGAATLMHLARAGAAVVGLDRFTPPHAFGSSHGETRITRLSIGEGPEYIPLVKRSHELWRMIEAESNLDILTVTGGLIFGCGSGYTMHGVRDFAQRTAELAAKFGIAHEVLSVGDAKARFPGFNIGDSDTVYYEPEAGFVRPENAVEAQLRIAQRSGAVLRCNERVTSIADMSGAVLITTASGEMRAARCLIAAGSWIREFLPESLRTRFKVYRQVLHWLPVEEGSYPQSSSPIFIWCYGPTDEDSIYGFPSIDGQTIKVATESFSNPIAPDAIERNVTVEEQQRFLKHKIVGRLDRVAGPPLRSIVCQYTVAPGSRFVIQRHPEIPGALFASCCSGHGFKHSAALGESIAALLRGEAPPVDLSAFAESLNQSL